MPAEREAAAMPGVDETPQIVPPLVADPIFVEAVDQAIIGDAFADSPEAQPDRLVSSCDFSSLYIRHRSALQIHARRFLNDAHDVEDVVQETFLRLFLAIPELETELQALAFSRRVLTNLCIDRYRAAKRRPLVVDLDSSPETTLIDLTELEDDPVLRAEDAAIVRQALALLSPLHRAALVKREIEEKSLTVIADELDVPAESVKHLLFRARRALRRLLVGTSVEPGCDLTLREAVAAAGVRGHNAMLRSAPAFVALIMSVVGVGAVAGAFRSAVPAGPDGQAVGTAPDVHPSLSPGGLAGPGGAGLRHGKARPATRTGTATSGHGSAGHAPATHSLTTVPSHGSSAPPPVGRADNGGHGPAVPPPSVAPIVGGRSTRFVLTGDVVSTGPATLSNAEPTFTGQGSVVGVSRFAAPTSGGTLVLNQTAVNPPDDAAHVSVAPSIDMAGDVVQIPVGDVNVQTQVTADGSNAVTVDMTVPDALPSPQMLVTGIRADILYAADGVTVLKETVTVSADVASVPSASVSASPDVQTP